VSERFRLPFKIIVLFQMCLQSSEIVPCSKATDLRGDLKFDVHVLRDSTSIILKLLRSNYYSVKNSPSGDNAVSRAHSSTDFCGRNWK